MRITIDASEQEQSGIQGNVVAYYAAQFDAWRKKCCGGDSNYLVSLGRCRYLSRKI